MSPTQPRLASPPRFLRVSQIVAPDGLLPISRSSWWRYVSQNRAPAGVRLSPGVRVWALDDVLAFASCEGR